MFKRDVVAQELVGVAKLLMPENREAARWTSEKLVKHIERTMRG